MTIKLSERAMLVSLNIRSWSATRTDLQVTNEVARQHGVSAKRAGHYRKHCIDVETPSYKAVKAAQAAMRNRHYDLTLPWSQDGARILTTALFQQYMDEMRNLKDEVEQAVATFCREYPALKAAAKLELNGLYNPADYPDNIESKFQVEITRGSLQDADDFRANLDQDTVDEIRQEIRARLEATVADAMREPYQRLYEHIGRMVERLSDPEGIFRDTLVTGLVDLCQLLPGLNLTKDPKLEELRKKAEALVTGISPDQLRKRPNVRKRVAKGAKDLQRIMDTMGDFMGGPRQEAAA